MHLDPDTKLRYVRFDGTPDKILEIEGYLGGSDARPLQVARLQPLRPLLPRQRPRRPGSIPSPSTRSRHGSYLAIALNGEHGPEGAYAAIRVNGKPVGAPDRSVSFPVQHLGIPAAEELLELHLLRPADRGHEGARRSTPSCWGCANGSDKFQPEVWITAYPTPFPGKILTLTPEPGPDEPLSPTDQGAPQVLFDLTGPSAPLGTFGAEKPATAARNIRHEASSRPGWWCRSRGGGPGPPAGGRRTWGSVAGHRLAVRNGRDRARGQADGVDHAGPLRSRVAQRHDDRWPRRASRSRTVFAAAGSGRPVARRWTSNCGPRPPTRKCASTTGSLPGPIFA